MMMMNFLLFLCLYIFSAFMIIGMDSLQNILIPTKMMDMNLDL